jgi:hypothetical protein
MDEARHAIGRFSTSAFAGARGAESRAWSGIL